MAYELLVKITFKNTNISNFQLLWPLYRPFSRNGVICDIFWRNGVNSYPYTPLYVQNFQTHRHFDAQKGRNLSRWDYVYCFLVFFCIHKVVKKAWLTNWLSGGLTTILEDASRIKNGFNLDTYLVFQEERNIFFYKKDTNRQL